LEFQRYKSNKTRILLGGIILGEAGKTAKIIIKFKKKQKIKMATNIVIACLFTMFMLWSATHV